MIHIRPSFFVRQTRIYKAWCRVTQCHVCETIGKYEDFHPVNPCYVCGASSKWKREGVGKWISLSKWYNPKSWYHGYWKIKSLE